MLERTHAACTTHCPKPALSKLSLQLPPNRARSRAEILIKDLPILTRIPLHSDA